MGGIKTYLHILEKKFEEQAKKQKMIEELAKESVDLNKMVMRVATRSPQKGTPVSRFKRKREDHDEVDD